MNSLRRLLAEVPQLEGTFNIWAGGLPGNQQNGAASTQAPPSPAHGESFSLHLLGEQARPPNLLIFCISPQLTLHQLYSQRHDR